MFVFSRNFILILLLCMMAYAGSSVTLEITAEEELIVVKKDGSRETVYVKPDAIIPGDIIRYRIDYRNMAEEPAESVVITNPVPEEVSYLGGSAAGSGTMVYFSIDGAKTFALPEDLVITDKHGNERLAMPKEYTHIQWRLQTPLPPQAEGSVTYRTKLK